MAGFRAYYDFADTPNVSATDIIVLSEEESRHLCGSLRAVVGDAVRLFDLNGHAFDCKITSASHKKCAVEVLTHIQCAQNGARVVLAQCLPKAKVFDEIIRQAVELGAAGIVPIVSEHSVSRIDGEDAAKKSLKWRAKIIEAVKQSANISAFKISPAQSSDDFFKMCGNFDVKIIASLRKNALPILDTLEKAAAEGSCPKNVCVLIGPEGDLSDAEYNRAEECGFAPVSLGRNVMKCDTAAACALSVCTAFLDCD